MLLYTANRHISKWICSYKKKKILVQPKGLLLFKQFNCTFKVIDIKVSWLWCETKKESYLHCQPDSFQTLSALCANCQAESSFFSSALKSPTQIFQGCFCLNSDINISNISVTTYFSHILFIPLLLLSSPFHPLICLQSKCDPMARGENGAENICTEIRQHQTWEHTHVHTS